MQTNVPISFGNVWQRTFLWEYANILYSAQQLLQTYCFGLTRCFAGSTSALISNSPFWPPPQLQVGKECTWKWVGDRNRERGGERERVVKSIDNRSYKEVISKDSSNFLMESPEAGLERNRNSISLWDGNKGQDSSTTDNTHLHWSRNRTSKMMKHHYQVTSMPTF